MDSHHSTLLLLAGFSLRWDPQELTPLLLLPQHAFLLAFLALAKNWQGIGGQLSPVHFRRP